MTGTPVSHNMYSVILVWFTYVVNPPPHSLILSWSAIKINIFGFRRLSRLGIQIFLKNIIPVILPSPYYSSFSVLTFPCNFPRCLYSSLMHATSQWYNLMQWNQWDSPLLFVLLLSLLYLSQDRVKYSFVRSFKGVFLKFLFLPLLDIKLLSIFITPERYCAYLSSPIIIYFSVFSWLYLTLFSLLRNILVGYLPLIWC